MGREGCRTSGESSGGVSGNETFDAPLSHFAAEKFASIAFVRRPLAALRALQVLPGSYVPKIILYAPNTHTGGGLVLLRALLGEANDGKLMAFLDVRARANLTLREDVSVRWVNPTLPGRIRAEFAVHEAAVAGDTIVSMSNLPPLLPTAGRVVVFMQNRYMLGRGDLSALPLKTRTRVILERFLGRTFSRRVAEYVVQSPSMVEELMEWSSALNANRKPVVTLLPFVDAIPRNGSSANPHPVWDFVYVADGLPHKNHRTLIQAWQLLSGAGLSPSLALTLGPRDGKLMREIEAIRDRSGLRITNLGHIGREEVFSLYANSRALIFPSTLESFGMPLIEAGSLGLPILASELDFVRDVCVPAESFDPTSPISISRAVRRFLGSPQPPVVPRSAAEFLAHVVRDREDGALGV